MCMAFYVAWFYNLVFSIRTRMFYVQPPLGAPPWSISFHPPLSLVSLNNWSIDGPVHDSMLSIHVILGFQSSWFSTFVLEEYRFPDNLYASIEQVWIAYMRLAKNVETYVFAVCACACVNVVDVFVYLCANLFMSIYLIVWVCMSFHCAYTQEKHRAYIHWKYFPGSSAVCLSYPVAIFN